MDTLTAADSFRLQRATEERPIHEELVNHRLKKSKLLQLTSEETTAAYTVSSDIDDYFMDRNGASSSKSRIMGHLSWKGSIFNDDEK